MKKKLVVDASVALKWVIDEHGTGEALALLERAALSAPAFLLAECANALWKKVRRSEFTREEALVAARILQISEVELFSTRPLLEAATRIAIELNHPAYDCTYVALALANGISFVTADERFLRMVRRNERAGFSRSVISLSDAVAGL